jgi:polyhydroxybutyrate depolymerase
MIENCCKNMSRVAVVPLALLIAGCASLGKDVLAIVTDASAAADIAVDALATRGYGLNVPTGYDPAIPTPLLVMLHGYSADGASQESYYFKLTAISEAKTFLYAYPNGMVGTVGWSTGYRFWNATDACCDFFHINPDDAAFFDTVVDEIASRYNVDARRIFVVGHSNGGFMAHRLACDRSSRVAAIISIAGAQWLDAGNCQPQSPVSVVEMHGDQDVAGSNNPYPIDYNGGSTYEGQYPSAHQTVSTWAQKDGCTGTLAETGQLLDLVPSLPGPETRIEAYTNCPSGIDVQLWTIQGGGHMDPLDTIAFGEAMWQFMTAHPKR